MTFKWNPFTLVEHNLSFRNKPVRLPRIIHHISHVMLGLWQAWIPMPLSLHIFLALLFAYIDKGIWFKDVLSPTRQLVWTGVQITNWPDAIADFGFTLLGALMPHLYKFAAMIYYILQGFSDP